LLPLEKTFSQANPKLWPGLNIAKVKKMAQGDFLDSATNLILIGKPGTGKTYIMAAVGHELVRAGRRVLFTKAQTLIEGLLTAKKDLELAKYLKKLDGFDCLMIDDIGYVPKESDETEVLFHLFNERYERRSLAITSNLVFSQWEKIFKDKMTTVAAVDRIVHHSIIIDCKWPSIRAAEAKMAHHNGRKEEKNVDANA
jgi:DNA replication protein DnaC